MLTSIRILLISFALTCCCKLNYAQNQFFKGGLNIGLTTSQIDGDNNAGFNKAGINAGAFVYAEIKANQFVQLEMNVVQKGSRKKPQKFDPSTWARRLNYIELPLLYKYKFKKLYYQGGISYAQLINQKFIDNGIAYQPREELLFKRNELGYLVGISYDMNEKLAFETKYSRSLAPIRAQAYFVSWLGFFGGSYNSVLSFTLKYKFNAND